MKEKAFCGLALVVLLGAQILLSARIDRTNPIPEYDEAVYADLARQFCRKGFPERRLGEGEGRFYYIHPYLQSLVWSVSARGLVVDAGENQTPADALNQTQRLRWTTTAIAIAMACLLFAISLRALGPKASVLCLFLLTMNPLWLRYSHLVYLEVPVAFWILASLAVVGGTGFGIIGGLLLGLAMVTKYTALPAVFSGAFLGAFLVYRKSETLKGGALWALGLAAGFATWPCFIFLRGSLGDWFAASLSRSRSFHVGQGGDPRTEWGPVDLVWETVGEIGPIHSAILAFGIFLLVIYARRVREGIPGVLLPHLFYVPVFLMAWLLSPTRDPKFIVIALPSICLLAAWGIGEAWPAVWTGRKSVCPKSALAGLAGVVLIAGFPVDVLGLDRTPLKKLYPTDHAYTRTCLPHGIDYEPISEKVREVSDPDDLVAVGRQGPIVGFLADRRYALLYTRGTADSFRELLPQSPVWVLDDSPRNMFPGLTDEERTNVLAEIDSNFSEKMKRGRIRLRWGTQDSARE